jgi:hypothetical protein
MDMPFLMNLRLPTGLQAKVNAPGAIGSVAAQGCADASLYQRFHQAGLTQEEAQQWQSARVQAEAEGTFFMAWPHHCAVGTKP